MKMYSVRKDVPGSVRKELFAYPELIQELLFYRGIENEEDAEDFLNPNYEMHVHDPFLMKDMNKAVKRVLGAIESDEKIVIYSDYDHDGIPGGVILHDFFKKIGYENFENYIPHRRTEGYSLNNTAVEQFAKQGVSLVITVDCGITDIKEVALAGKLGIDVIITDHHLPLDNLPPAYAILNPKQENDTYPCDMLCGAGVAFKLVCALLKELQASEANEAYKLKAVPAGWEKWLLDMAGMATIADMVPLQGENRALAHYGLKVLRKSPRPGIVRLCEKINIQQRELTEDDVGFMITPRINAASRMDRPMEAFRLLATRDNGEADALTLHLNKINDERKGMVAATVKEIKKRLAGLGDLRDVIVLGNPNWRPALLGLAANSVVEEYNRPVCLWGREGGSVIKGSCRSDGSIDVVELMAETNMLFLDYGGHQFSSGFSIANENIHLLEDELMKAYKKVNVLESDHDAFVDKKLFLDDVNWQTYKMIEQLAPFGIGNPKPIFLFENILVFDIANFGRDNNHLRLTFKNGSGGDVTAITFFSNTDSFSKPVSKGERINLVATVEKSTFRRTPELRLRIVDVI